MISEKRTVFIYLFDKGDGKETEERLCSITEDYALRSGLCEVSEDRFLLKRTERGKPYFPNSPEIGVSVSHSGEYAICALCRGDLGIDLQEHRRLVSETIEDAEARFKRMARRFYHPREAEFVENDTFLRFFAVWSAKESYVKYTGKGIDNDFSAFCVLPDHSADKMIRECGEEFRWKALGKEFCLERFADAYTLCVCADGPFDIEIIKSS